MKKVFSDSPVFLQLIELPENYQPEEPDIERNRSGRLAFYYPSRQAKDSVFVKRVRPRHGLEKLKYLFKMSRARAEVVNNSEFKARGIPVPEILAFLESRRFGFWRYSLVVSTPVKDAISLWVRSECDVPLENSSIHRLAELVADIHNAGIYHKDLHCGNILVSTDDRGEDAFTIIDFNEASFNRSTSNSMCWNDLSRLNAFVTVRPMQRYRFLLTYMKCRGLEEKRDWLANIKKQTEKLWKDYEKSRGVAVRKY